jgi:hypothetical protein
MLKTRFFSTSHLMFHCPAAQSHTSAGMRQGADWPVVPRREEDGTGQAPIVPTFLGQVDLGALPPVPQRNLLPSRGTLYFFCNTQFFDLGDPACKVLYDPHPCDDFTEQQPPSGLMNIGGNHIDAPKLAAGGDPKVASFKPIRFRHGPSYPDYELLDGEWETKQAFERLCPFDYSLGTPPQMLGFAYLVQPVEQFFEGDVLLLQLGAGFEWNPTNCGCTLQMWIKREDLAKRVFDKVTATLMCS